MGMKDEHTNSVARARERGTTRKLFSVEFLRAFTVFVILFDTLPD
jgi:hypothetical protein